MGMSFDYSKDNQTNKRHGYFEHKMDFGDSQYLRCFKNQDKSAQRLSLLEKDKLKDRVGDLRFEQYLCNLENEYEFFLVDMFLKGNLEGEKRREIFNHLIGIEFNVYVVEMLKKLGCRDIQQEVKVKGTRIDATAVFKGNEKFVTIEPNMEEKEHILKPGIHTFEAKAKYELDDEKPVRQIQKARGQYKNCHVLVLADTRVPAEINKKVRNAGGDIIRAEITKKGIIDRVYSLTDSSLH